MEDSFYQPTSMQRMTLTGLHEMTLVPPMVVDAISWSTDGSCILAYSPEDEDGRRTIARYDRDGNQFVFRASARYRKAADGSWLKESPAPSDPA